jgi:predicted NAD-dependent protein-ADP-ribosyltransferase YbiA (DUF1768 family)
MTEKNILSNGVINFFSGKKEYRSLSNFWENDIIIIDGDLHLCTFKTPPSGAVMSEQGDADCTFSMCNGVKRIYESGEHCFHGEKYIRLGELCEDETRKKVLLDYGSTFMKPSQYKTGTVAKKMGGKKGLLLNGIELKLWTAISIEVQHQICMWKVNNYEEVRNDLMKSGNKILIHPAMRCSQEILENYRTWEGKGIVVDGKIVVLGKNLLGNIWMEYR